MGTKQQMNMLQESDAAITADSENCVKKMYKSNTHQNKNFSNIVDLHVAKQYLGN